MRLCPLILLCLVPVLAGLAPAAAQTLTGDGLRGDYYAGRNFERYVTSRYDKVIDFDWRQQPPVSGVPEANFSVRWTGWLVPPTTGDYTLAVLADDGARLWLNGKQLINEWRGQEASLFQVIVPLKAGQPYRLRLDYDQYRWDTRVLLSWVPPNAPVTAANPFGLPNGGAPTTALPTRYLFSHNPTPKPAVVAPPRPMPTGHLGPVVVAARLPAPRRPITRATGPPVRVAARPTATRARVAARPTATRATALGAQLASGQALTMRTLYFEQGKAFLLPAVQASLDTLAEALRQRPTLRLQVQGHTDNQGDSALNRQLSQRRAEAVCQYLHTHGVAAGRLRPVGLGGRYPVADNSLPAERPRNRRVVLVGEVMK